MNMERNIDNDQFDQLLAQCLLNKEELFNGQNTEIMATQIFSLNAEYLPIENTQVLKKLELDFGSTKQKWRLDSWWIIAVLVAITSAVIWFTRTESIPFAMQTNSNVPVEETHTTVSASEQVEVRNKRTDPEMVMPVVPDSLAEVKDIAIENIGQNPFTNGQTFMHIPEPYNEEYLEIPFLTEADKKKNHKRKLQLLKEIIKKKSFSDIPAGPSWRNGERFEVNQFAMQNAEVSNWQYTVFLNELIMQARTDDYFLCKPVNGNWKAVGIPEFETMYAQTEGHEKDPVLNISRKAAEMYCVWLTTSMREAIDKKEVKWTNTARPDFRLPTDIEWTRAARGNDSTLQFPWGAHYNALQNTRGCYMCNFNYSISKGSLSPEGPVGSKGCISEKPNLRGVITTAGRAIDTLVLGPEYCYNPTNFGQYCMLGNAAEMVWKYERDPSSPPVALSMGGSWYSHADEVRIESKQQYVGVTEANVAIGFRCAMVLTTH